MFNERNFNNETEKFVYYVAVIFVKSFEISYRVFVFVEDEFINKFKNKIAISNINVGEVWREFENTVHCCDWIVLNKTKTTIVVSNIKDYSNFIIKEVEPRVIYELWTKC